ncbi:MAG: DNA-processing protein DprA [Pantoea sp.]|uniref:DNA-processing protein DprA n=1 Tax=Pantoea sp. TaxID=69393 RepID=UPI0039E3377A
MEENSNKSNNLVDFWKNEIVAFLALTSVKGVGYWTLRKIFESGLGFKNILKDVSPEVLLKHVRISLPLDIPWETYRQDLWNIGLDKARSLNKQGVSLHFFEQNSFPESLRNIPDPPYWIFVEGNLDNLSKKSVAIVGTRRPSEDGIFLTKLITSLLVDKNIVTVSGLAAGIDQVCHVESIRYGIPTIAVLGNGILVEYPRGSNVIRNEIVANGGTILTEYLPEQTFSAENFVRRNRLQAALCSTLVPVEWKIKSGTAHTVDYAYKYSKKIASVYLPKTYFSRPELKFSEENKLALSFEVPRDMQLVENYIMESHGRFDTEPKQQILDL